MSNIYAKAYTELYEILKNIPEKDINKIPNEVLVMLEEKKDKNYIFQLQENIEFENQVLLRETKILLAIIYRDFWATEEEKEKIIQKWKYDIQKDEEEKKLKYNVERLKEKPTNACNYKNYNNLPIEINRENLFVKIISFIKRYLRFK